MYWKLFEINGILYDVFINGFRAIFCMLLLRGIERGFKVDIL